MLDKNVFSDILLWYCSLDCHDYVRAVRRAHLLYYNIQQSKPMALTRNGGDDGDDDLGVFYIRDEPYQPLSTPFNPFASAAKRNDI